MESSSPLSCIRALELNIVSPCWCHGNGVFALINLMHFLYLTGLIDMVCNLVHIMFCPIYFVFSFLGTGLITKINVFHMVNG